MFQHVSTCFNMFQHVSTCFNHPRWRMSTPHLPGLVVSPRWAPLPGAAPVGRALARPASGARARWATWEGYWGGLKPPGTVHGEAKNIAYRYVHTSRCYYIQKYSKICLSILNIVLFFLVNWYVQTSSTWMILGEMALFLTGAKRWEWGNDPHPKLCSQSVHSHIPYHRYYLNMIITWQFQICSIWN